ncbi:MAG: preprotein translocase subunit SecG [Candidatus Omnitrophica bacterium]|nr:preprotein translocase subunit SecG [Candidatus Omnitrophota bacterium]
MMIFLVIVHVTACIVLIALVLIQRGRGSGLVESFSGVESMFGTKTSAFLTRTTTIMSVVFFITCLSLAVLSVHQSKSLMRSRSSVKAGAGSSSSKAVQPVTEKAGSGAGKAPVNAAPVLPAESAKPAAEKAQ